MSGIRGIRESIAYWTQWTLLQVYGPAEQDREHDPIELLKRKYHRSPRKW